jgi:hypothetical protein
MIRKQKPKRKFRRRTEEELDRDSEVTPQDIERAKAFLARAAPLAAKLLDATLDEGEGTIPNG